MQLKTILNRVLRHSAFVYVAAHLVETVAGPTVEVQLRARANSRPRCSCCKRPGPGCDTLAQRCFEFVPYSMGYRDDIEEAGRPRTAGPGRTAEKNPADPHRNYRRIRRYCGVSKKTAADTRAHHQMESRLCK
ncbi:MAG: hypothetical protein GY807_22195 [Gammaproteobacteria bacterium]|nr:hypothetical protein [Gammaproteobacteria bacterium]